MSASRLSGARVAGLACAAPAAIRTAEESAALAGISPEEGRKIAASTGVRERHISPRLCTSDLCFAAAERLLTELRWERESIDLLIFVSQTPDYRLPATSCCLHHRLGLSKNCAAMDINLGCSGYVYGLWTVSGLIAAGAAKRALLLVGDTAAFSSPEDRSVAFLFGDAGTATALEKQDTGEETVFVLGTDGAGRDHLIVRGGGARHPVSAASLVRTQVEPGILRNELEVAMNGGEIFAFTLREVAPLVKGALVAAGWTLDTPAAFVFHQANSFMLQHLSKRLKIPPQKLPMVLEQFGNTSCASIPLAIHQTLRTELQAGQLQLLLAGFGVGYSWGAAAVTWGPLVIPELALVEEPVQAGAVSS